MTDEKVVVVADIGGTNARFAHLDGRGQPGPLVALATADYPGPGKALEDYLRLSGRSRPQVFILALAGPVSGGEATLSAHEWRFSIKDLKDELRLDRLEVLNDFEATALALPLISPEELIPVGPRKTPKKGRLPLAVLGPGTGLGMAGLLPEGRGWKVVSSEGGYTALAPYDDRELAAWKILRSKHGRVFKELVLSGPGLTALHEALSLAAGREPETLSPRRIVRLALSGESRPALETVEIFCAWLGDAALIYNARGGVYLAGGIVPRIIEILVKSRFRKRFEDKGWGSSVVRAIPVWAITSPVQALLGCAGLA